MAPVSDEDSLELHLERQMGCMAGLLHQLVHSKRIYTHHAFPTTAEGSTSSPENTPARSTLPLPVFDSWKVRESPRLSLDSRLRPREARVKIPVAGKSSGSPDAESEKIRRPPSLVARLMGLDNLPEPVEKAELRRSASESRVPRDPYRFAEDFAFEKHSAGDLAPERRMESRSKPPPPSTAKTTPATRMSFFDACDFFPDLNRTGSRSICNEIDRRLRINEPAKQILEASQLKGLLKWRQSEQDIHQLCCRPPVVVLEPDPKPVRRRAPDPRRIRSPILTEPIARKPRCPEPRRRVPPPPKKPTPAVGSPRNHKPTAEVPPNVHPIQSPALLERCDELLRSITSFTSVDQQPSPVSVLDSVNIESADLEDDRWAQPFSAVGLDIPESDGADFAYVYDILCSSCRLCSLDDAYILLEKRHGAADESEPSVLHRRLIFDMVISIISRKRHVSTWEAFSKPNVLSGTEQLVREVWLEVRRTREDIAGGIGGDHGWSDASAEMSDAVVLHIERLLFKDVVADTIRGIADVCGGKSLARYRRKLVF